MLPIAGPVEAYSLDVLSEANCRNIVTAEVVDKLGHVDKNSSVLGRAGRITACHGALGIGCEFGNVDFVHVVVWLVNGLMLSPLLGDVGQYTTKLAACQPQNEKSFQKKSLIFNAP